MTEDPRIGTPGTYEFSAPDGVLDVAWLGEDPEADERARSHAEQVEKRSGGEFLITRIRRRDADGWQIVPRTAS